MKPLSDLKCAPCRGDNPPLRENEITEMLPQVPDWQILEIDGVPRLERIFKFKDFSAALEFTDQVGALAEVEDHHPLIVLECCSTRDRASGRRGWKVNVQWWTHVIKGLHKNDFVMAAKVDLLQQ